MSDSETLKRELKQSVATGINYIQDDLTASFDKHLTDIIIPTLTDLLKAKSDEIQQQHSLVNAPKDEHGIHGYFIHYTSVNTIFSMIQTQAHEVSRSRTNTKVAQPNDSSPQPEHRENTHHSGGSLRLYDSAHFNDPDEGNYFANQLLDSPQYDWLKQDTSTHAYIASFIIPKDKHRPEDARDNLVFWRTYGREGEGCSLQLNIDQTKLSRVSYDKDELQNTIDVLQPVVEILTPISHKSDSRIKQRLRETFWRSLGRIKYLYKSVAYEYEQECRYIIPALDIDDDEVSFEYKYEGDSTGQLRHYCETDDLAIPDILGSGCSITIGPCVSDKDDLKASLDTLLKRADMSSGRSVFTSGISYRRT